MTKIIFITSGKIEYQLGKLSLYESMIRVGMGKEFPHITKDARVEILKITKELKKSNPVIIYSATSFQTIETANIISRKLNLKIIKSKNLLPLRFNLNNLIQENDFYNFKEEKFNIVREKFLTAFFENKLLDDNNEIKRRFKYLIKVISKKQKNKTVIVVSHAYLIKLFYVYYKLGDRMFIDKNKLFNLFQPSKEPLGRLGRFEIKI
ncbi:hypothetical protein BH10PAT1_BH10PAT1_6500 [soil metagenome]